MKLTEKDKKEVLDFLSKHKLMSIGTYYKLPWSACVYYLFDDNFNLYFVSNPKTKHCVNISKNSKVSIVIVNSEQDPEGKKKGFQARGIASKVTSAFEVKEIIKAWNKRGFVKVTYREFKKAWKSRFYKIKLTDIQLFDENQPEENEVRIWKI
jgi:uncharacterized protein YhbP (UPF0306 family)